MFISVQWQHLFSFISPVLLITSLATSIVNAQIPLQINDAESIKAAAAIAARGMMASYPGDQPGQIPGIWPPPYYWWEAGAAWGALVDYWYYTGSEEWMESTTKALLFQTGPQNNYMPPNQSRALGNDDQCFWALAVMAAAEKKYPDPPKKAPQWLALAQAVFNTQVPRWDETNCKGGLRWQIFTFNNGFDYKNTVSNGCFFQLGARLARYTGNTTYADWAIKAYDWTVNTGLLTKDWFVKDGIEVVEGSQECPKMTNYQWTYNAGLYLAGSAYMYNFTNGDPLWKERVDGLLQATRVFFANEEWGQGETDVMYEATCEPGGNCNVDQRSFKAYLSRFMALTVKMAPHTRDYIMPKLRKSAEAAARMCKGGPDRTTCSLKWSKDDWNASLTGLGEQMAALEVIQSNLIDVVGPPVTADTGGTSEGDPSAGTTDERTPQEIVIGPVKMADKVGAGFLTAGVLSGVLGGAYWMVMS